MTSRISVHSHGILLSLSGQISVLDASFADESEMTEILCHSLLLTE